MEDHSFTEYFKPVPKFESVLKGHEGSIFGVEVFTDSFRQPDKIDYVDYYHNSLRIIEDGDVFVSSAPIKFGALIQEKKLSVELKHDILCTDGSLCDFKWVFECIEHIGCIKPSCGGQAAIAYSTEFRK